MKSEMCAAAKRQNNGYKKDLTVPQTQQRISCCIACDIILLKQGNIDTVLKQCDELPCTKHIAVDLGIKFPSITLL
jgi:GTP:adenosylcobinamide-phosphate guanylyltransferase